MSIYIGPQYSGLADPWESEKAEIRLAEQFEAMTEEEKARCCVRGDPFMGPRDLHVEEVDDNAATL